MKLLTFRIGDQDRVGALKGNSVVDIAVVIDSLRNGAPDRLLPSALPETARQVLTAGVAPRDMIDLLERGEAFRRALGQALAALPEAQPALSHGAGLLTPLDEVRLRAPILRPGKIICVGLNYESHRAEQLKKPLERVVLFLKSHNAICGPGEPIVLPVNSEKVDYEAEFAVVIGRRGKRIPLEQAFEHIAGYTVFNDVSARDLQIGDGQWFRGKSCDTFAPAGPWIVTWDEIPDPNHLRLSLQLNGRTMQDANTRDLIYKIPFLISYLSQSLTLEPGDLFSTGTPGGVGHYRQPPVYLKPGDTVSVTVEGIGTLTNPVVGPAPLSF
jgi:2-keto-4-pentenoate hydratase/2-oxohepta-3-ene-1,7-dioic acid hydratase in catechol pathway